MKEPAPKPKALFVCIENAGRSQMAEGFARSLGRDVLEAWSAGSKPSGKVNPKAVDLMRELDIDISGHRSKGLSELPPLQWDYVITMGCGDDCPLIPARERLDWNLEDPKDKPLEDVRRIRDDIGRRVAEFVDRVARFR